MEFYKKYSVVFFALLAFFLTIGFLGFENLNFQNSKWLYTVADISNSQNGWIFFKNDIWHFPFGKNPNYGLDIASSIIFSDSIPLFAFFFKIFKNFLPEIFQYFTLWIFLCFFLQSYIAFLIIYKKTNNIHYSILSSFLFIIAPIFIYRLGVNLSLGGQWLILLGYYIYLYANKDKANYFWVTLLVLSTLVHLYFTVMLFVIYGFYILGIFLNDKNIKRLLINISSSILIVLTFMYFFGYFETEFMGSVSKGYGVFGLDVLGVFDPQNTTDGLDWSFFLNNIEGSTGEGFNYLGVGVISLFFVVILAFLAKCIKDKNFIKIFLKKYISFLFIVIFLICWAITTKVHFAGRELLDIPIPDYVFGVLSIFGATGRFFWPVYYLIIFFSLFYLYDNFKKKYSFFGIILILIIQIVDLSPGLKNYFLDKKHIGQPKILKSNIWKELPQNFDNLRTTYLFNNYGPIFLSLDYFLGTSNIKKTDIVLSASLPRAKAASARYRLTKNIYYQKKLPSNTAYLVDNLGHLKQIKYYLKESNDGFFFRDGFWLVLPGHKEKMNNEDINDIGKIIFNDFKINKRYDFRFKKRDEYLGFGWSHNSSNMGVWTEGNLSFLLFSLNEVNKNDLEIILNIEPYKNNTNKNFDIEIYLNDTLKETINLYEQNDIENIYLNLTYEEIKKENIIVFKFSNLQSPLDTFKSPDARKLGMLLKSMKIVKK
jgi:hypothetical protein